MDIRAGKLMATTKGDVPIVVMKLGVQASSQNLSNKHDLPTPGVVDQ